MRSLFLILLASPFMIFMTASAAYAAPEALELDPSAAINLDELNLEGLPAAKTLPDSPFYFLKTLKEKLQLFLTPSAAGQAELLLKFSQKRLSEALKIYEKGKTTIGDRLLKLSLDDLKAAQQKILIAQGEGQQIFGIVRELQQSADYQQLAVQALKGSAENVNDFLLQIDERLVVQPATESARIRPIEKEVEHPPNRLQQFWRQLFGPKEILRPLVD